MVNQNGTAFLIIYLLLPVVLGDFMTVGAGVLAAVSAGFQAIRCIRTECCTDRWISLNYTDLRLTLDAKLYGQHLVIESVIKHLKAQGKDNPQKALALSFHGSTGTGKNYVTQIIAEKMFVKGMKSKYVHLISAIKEFPRKEMTDFYKDKLKDFIEARVKECPRAFFIIHHLDKMPQGITNTLIPYLDSPGYLKGVDYRKTLFVFISNTAGTDIAERTLTHWKNNQERESIKLKEMEEVIKLHALKDKSGLWHSELIQQDLITAYIPFLPLERRHVKQCIRDGLIDRGYYKSEEEIPEAKVQEIADEMQYYPHGVFLFSITGCKRIYERTAFIMEEL